MSEASRPILTVRGVSKRYGELQALHPTDLAISAGEFVTLLGPSGCGKTTLLRIIAGLETADEGRLHGEDGDLTRLGPERRPFNMVFQNYALFPHLNVFENVAYGLRADGLDNAQIVRRVDEALGLVSLRDFREAAPGALSGGMRQRVALVRAVVKQPRILLLDEPLAALDLQLRKRMQVELRAIQQRLGTTFVLVTHDQEEALVLSDRIVVMRAGRIEQTGSPREIYTRPISRFVADFIGETTLLPVTVVAHDADGVEVRLPDGAPARFTTHPSLRLGPGDAAAVSIRPEDLTLAEPGTGAFSGTVTLSVFTGFATRLTIEIAPDQGIVAMAPGDADIASGTRVGLALRPGAGVCVPAA